MTGEIIRHGCPSYLPRCIAPPCVPVHEEYSRITNRRHHPRRRLMKLLRKMLSESKSICGPPPPKSRSFQYDAVSYSQNFDDGRHRDDDCAPQPLSPPLSRKLN